MPRTSQLVDAEGLTLAWMQQSGLTGPGTPFPSGAHLDTDNRRSPGKGVVCQVDLRDPREVDIEGAGDAAPVTFTVSAPGTEQGARRAASGAAQALRRQFDAHTGSGAMLVTAWPGGADESQARLMVIHTVGGPVLTGQGLTGKVSYSVTATFVWQLIA